jgi:hypothetical protein
MATYVKVAASTNGERELSIDRLSKIDGIARKTAKAMYEIGIRSYADLAQYLSQHTDQEVSEALKEHGVNRPPAFIDPGTWARQARELSDLENTAPTLPEEGTEPPAEPQEALFSQDSQEHDAVFTVSFDLATDGDRRPVLRTTVCDGANGDQEEVFQGSGTAPWVNWIMERAHVLVPVGRIATQAETTGDMPPNKTEATTPPLSVGRDDTRIEITDVELSVIEPTADDPQKTLMAEINFQLSGSGAEMLASKSIPFRIDGYTVDAESGVSELVASDRCLLEPQVFKYIGLQEFAMPDVGRYQFHTMVLFLPPVELAAYHRGPALRILP